VDGVSVVHEPYSGLIRLGGSVPILPLSCWCVLPPTAFRPTLPSPAERPPIGGEWIHEIKHDGFRMMVRGEAAGFRCGPRALVYVRALEGGVFRSVFGDSGWRLL